MELWPFRPDFTFVSAYEMLSLNQPPKTWRRFLGSDQYLADQIVFWSERLNSFPPAQATSHGQN
jgi:hypothetical protein